MGLAHSAPDGLDDVDGAFARFQECHGVEFGGVGAFAENAHVDDAVGMGFGSVGKFFLGVVARGDVAGCVKMFHGICGGVFWRAVGGVLAEPILHPVFDGGGLQILRHVLGLVHGVHKGDAGFDGDAVVLGVVGSGGGRLGSAAHRQRESQALQVVHGGELAASLALGVLRQSVGFLIRLVVVDADCDDAVVG